MEPADTATRGRAGTSIRDILDQASRLCAPAILALSRSYPSDPPGRRARTHMLEVAGSRDGRPSELRRLKAAAATAIRLAAARDRAEASLARLGVLIDAELAVQDAVLAAFLADRLGQAQIEQLSRPWRDLP